ncbi:glycosyltransferase family 39 protein [uncultured Phycicoccus sp.]|uniref:glycosyltransferase family 39 protein n=1 Tax=uncultured Phycicoccus sp. TaxID=661422 RepID=UPI0026185892|nr:glycosyltransferase family 39 protein [uncultured Phycicoccus sp.]
MVAAATQAVVLTLGSVGYGYHRDELYFRMLPPDWGYVDQPPLAPWLARTLAAVVDEPWALRVPATLASAVTVLLLALLARELGGDRRAEAFAAWGGAFATLPLALGHLLLTSTIDLAMTVGVVVLACRALRGDPRWWLAVGALSGLASLNRLLIPVVLAGLVLGVLLLGPRRSLGTPWPWAGALVAVVLAGPSIAYQVVNGWPQLAMGAALGENNAAEVRSQLPLILLVAIGPLLVPVWLAGAVHAWRRPEARWLVVAAVVLVAFAWVSGAQPHYPVALLAALFAAGCVPVARWTRAAPWRRWTLAGVLAVSAGVSTVLAVPVVPLTVVGATPVTEAGPLVGDQVGWPRYVEQVADVWRAAGDPDAAVLTSNYGEAGAVARFGPALGLAGAVSGHNHLWELGPPPEATRTVVVVGAQYEALVPLFERCEVRDRLSNGVGVDNEEEGVPVALCQDPVAPWSVLWPRVRHLD